MTELFTEKDIEEINIFFDIMKNDSTFRELVNKYRIELEFSAYSDESYKKFKAMRHIYNVCVLKERYKCKEGLDE